MRRLVPLRAAVAQQMLDTHDKLDKITMRVADHAAVMQQMVDDMELSKTTMLAAMGEFSFEQGVLSTRIKMTGDAQQSIRNELLKMQAVAADDNMKRSIGDVEEHDTCKREITEMMTEVARNVQDGLGASDAVSRAVHGELAGWIKTQIDDTQAAVLSVHADHPRYELEPLVASVEDRALHVGLARPHVSSTHSMAGPGAALSCIRTASAPGSPARRTSNASNASST